MIACCFSLGTAPLTLQCGVWLFDHYATRIPRCDEPRATPIFGLLAKKKYLGCVISQDLFWVAWGTEAPQCNAGARLDDTPKFE